MSDENGSILGSKDVLFVLLTALTKRSGGEIKITEEELASVTKQDAVRLCFDRQTNEVTLSTHPIEPLSKLDIN